MTTLRSTAPATRIDPGPVRLWLALDAAVTGVNGLAYLILAGPLAALLGAGTPTLLGVGAFLVVFAAAIVAVIRGGARAGGPVRPIVVVNAVWVVASLTAAAGLELTVLGRVWVVLQAVVVGGFALAQYRTGWRARQA